MSFARQLTIMRSKAFEGAEVRLIIIIILQRLACKIIRGTVCIGSRHVAASATQEALAAT